jgi:hypothetical protein
MLIAENEELVQAVEARAKARQGTRTDISVPVRESSEKGESNQVLGQMAGVGKKQSSFQYFCRECNDYFALEVVHCLHCGHHYPPGDEECSNCHNPLSDSPITEKNPSAPARQGLRSGRTDVALAKMAGIGETTIRQARLVAEHGTEEQKQAVRSGQAPGPWAPGAGLLIWPVRPLPGPSALWIG